MALPLHPVSFSINLTGDNFWYMQHAAEALLTLYSLLGRMCSIADTLDIVENKAMASKKVAAQIFTSEFFH